jgi:hypothetical protein
MIIGKNLKLCALAAFIITRGMRAAEPMNTTQFIKIDKYSIFNSAIFAINGDKRVGEIKYSVPRCWIESLEIAKESQKKGIGSQLFTRAINEMSSCEDIRWTSYLSSIDFYRKQGAQIDTQSQCYADRILWQGTDSQRVCFKDATEKEKASYANYLHKLNKADPTKTFPHVSMFFKNKKQR